MLIPSHPNRATGHGASVENTAIAGNRWIWYVVSLMDKATRTICGLLQSPDGMRRCAAAMVLAELAPKDGAVVKALGETLKDANQLLTRYILEAFEAIATRAVVPHVLPLLESADVETKLRAASIVARAGGSVVSELKRHFEKATVQQRLVLVDILARIHSREAMQLILDTLFDPDPELVKETCQAVRRHIVDAQPKDRVGLHRQVVKFMNGARVRKNDRVLTSCLLLAGYISAPEARRVLLKYSEPRNPTHIRRHALLGLRGLELTGAAVHQVAHTMIRYLAEPDFVNIGQPALDIVEKLPLPRSYAGQWRRLLRNKHASVRAFAARRLAATEDAATNRLMMTLLQHSDPQISEIAAGALARHRSATKLLLAALARESKPEPAWRLAKILKPHGGSVDKPTRKRFVVLACRALENGQPRHEALLYFLRNIDPALADGVWRDVGLKFRKARKWTKAIDCLRRLIGTNLFDCELRYELSVCNLKVSPKEVHAHIRSEDHALRGFQTLVSDKGFKLYDRLLRDKTLDVSDVYYLGFHFSEGIGDEQRFGCKLLKYVAQRWKRSKEGKQAQNKLKLISQSTEVTPTPVAVFSGNA